MPSKEPRQKLAPESQLRLHLEEPDYARPLLEMTPPQRDRILEKLTSLYGRDKGVGCFGELERIMQVYWAHKTPEMIADDRCFDPAEHFTEKDIILITYGDVIRRKGETPLRALADCLKHYAQFSISTIHILPFFPYSSDRGFSIIDYEEVDPNLGTWKEIEELSLNFRLMFDGVFNHVSSKSRWFQEFLNGNPRYGDFFIKFSTRNAVPDDYLSLILRPRTSDLLTGFDTIRGRQYVWTTFSKDQIDLNFQNEEVLLRIVDVLLYYVRRGADFIRLDAITYIWAELGTSCALLEESHVLVQLFRAVLDVVAPQVALVTETNVPHESNISYLADGKEEAQMVYNFALPPLVLHAFQTGNVDRLSQWADSLEHISDQTTYFNFLDSHDGIGLLPVRDILSQEEMEAMVRKARKHGGLVSLRTEPDGSESPYEINITWFSALNKPDSGETEEIQVDRFVASRSISLVLMGVPGIYLPSLTGHRNDILAVIKDRELRSINRTVLDEEALIQKLNDPSSFAHKILGKFGCMIQKRIRNPAFHPNARQQIVHVNSAVFSVLREQRGGGQRILALTNVTKEDQRFELELSKYSLPAGSWRDLLTNSHLEATKDILAVDLAPYEVKWMTPEEQ